MNVAPRELSALREALRTSLARILTALLGRVGTLAGESSERSWASMASRALWSRGGGSSQGMPVANTVQLSVSANSGSIHMGTLFGMWWRTLDARVGQLGASLEADPQAGVECAEIGHRPGILLRMRVGGA